jgi:hypothetical protein
MDKTTREGAVRSPMPPDAATAPSGQADLGAEMAARVEASPLHTEPFDHVYVEYAFSASWYRRLLGALPEIRRYREFRHRDAMRPDGHSARRKFYLYPEHLVFLPAEQRAVWREVSRALRSPALEEVFKQKFRSALERRFGRSIARLSFYPIPILLRDLPGYGIGVHGDSLGKAITVQFYLPADDSQAHLGTVLHEGREGAGAERVKKLGFRPATGYAFPVLRRESWHSVTRTREEDGERNSLMLTYYVQDTLPAWLGHRLKRLWVFLAYGLRR